MHTAYRTQLGYHLTFVKCRVCCHWFYTFDSASLQIIGSTGFWRGAWYVECVFCALPEDLVDDLPGDRPNRILSESWGFGIDSKTTAHTGKALSASEDITESTSIRKRDEEIQCLQQIPCQEERDRKWVMTTSLWCSSQKSLTWIEFAGLLPNSSKFPEPTASARLETSILAAEFDSCLSCEPC